MSHVLAGKVWESGLDARLKPLCAAIADVVNRDGEGLFASVMYLAWMTGLSERSVQDQMRDLREARILVATCHPECQERPGSRHGARQTVEYRLDVGQLPAREPWEQYRSRHLEARRSSPERGAEPAPLKGEEPAPIEGPGRVQNGASKGADDDTEGCEKPHPIRDLDPGLDPGVPVGAAQVRVDGARDATEQFTRASERSGKVRSRLSVAFRGRIGNSTQRRMVRDLCAQGLLDADVEHSIEITREAPRDDDYGYCIGVMRECIERRKRGEDPYGRSASSGGGSRPAPRGRGAGARSGDPRGGGGRDGRGRVPAAVIPKRTSDV